MPAWQALAVAAFWSLVLDAAIIGSSSGFRLRVAYLCLMAASVAFWLLFLLGLIPALAATIVLSIALPQLTPFFGEELKDILKIVLSNPYLLGFFGPLLSEAILIKVLGKMGTQEKATSQEEIREESIRELRRSLRKKLVIEVRHWVSEWQNSRDMKLAAKMAAMMDQAELERSLRLLLRSAASSQQEADKFFNEIISSLPRDPEARRQQLALECVILNRTLAARLLKDKTSGKKP